MTLVPTDRKLFRVATHFNVSKEEIVEYLRAKGFEDVSTKPTFVLSDAMLEAVAGHFAKEAKSAERVRSKLERHRTFTKKESPLHPHQEPRTTVPEIIPSHQQAVSEASPLPKDEISSTVAIESTFLYPVSEESLPTASISESKELQPEAIVVEFISKPESEQITSHEQIPEIGLATNEPESEVVTTQELDLQSLPTEHIAGQIIPPTETYSIPNESSPQSELSTSETLPEDLGETKRRRRLSNVIITSEPDTPSTSWQLRGLTVVGKIELPVDQPRRGRKQSQSTAKGAQAPKRAEPPVERVKNRQKQTQQSRRQPEATSIEKPLLSNLVTIEPQFPVKQKDKKTSIRDELLVSDDKAKKKRKPIRQEIEEEEVERAIRETLAGIESEARIKAKIKKQRKQQREERQQRRQEQLREDQGIIHVTEFVTVAELANIFNVSAAEIISKCLSLGLMVSINQRLDKDTIQLIASDYDITVEFLSDKEIVLDEELVPDPSEALEPRPPIVTIMGHVDHGKTSLLDYIRSSNIVAGEAGGITQHIGAYKVVLPHGKSLTFLDTPGHEAFTAMRARGAQVTDIVVLVVAADDSVMPQTVEAISHARAANVPIVVAINKIDKDTANPDRIKQQLADHGILVEEWGGKYQCVEISAKKGINVDILLEKILLEAELLDFKANHHRSALGTVIEAHVDKGRGNVATILVQNGTLRQGDAYICGQFFGRVRSMYDERGHRVTEATPSTPVQVTGFDGLPEAGDKLVVSIDYDKLRQIALQRQILRREEQLRQTRRLSLDEISQRIHQGGVKELRIVLKADVMGSLEALTEALHKLSTHEVKVSIIHRAVGTITESDVMLAAASDAIVVGFQVQLPATVRKVAERESVDVRLYSIIYDAINEIQLALEGLLSPEIKEEVVGRAEVRQLFKITKVGAIAGCYVQSGIITRNDKVRIIREGFEIYKGTIQSLKHHKEDVREMRQGFECGLTVSGFNDYAEGDIIEAYRITEVHRKLSQ